MRKILTIVGGVLIVLLVGGAAFYGGMRFESARSTNARTAFLAGRGSLGEFGGAGFGAGPRTFGQLGGTPGPNATPGTADFGGGASGRVKSVEGDTLLLSTAQDVTTVILTDQTSILRIVSGTRAELQPGQQVTIIGQRGENGEITATAIQILPQEP